MPRNIYVLGGAGFVGSAVARLFAERGDRVTVIDGFLAHTGAAEKNLADKQITLRRQAIEELDTDDFVAMSQADVIVDAMAWTSHLQAIDNPNYDLQLNVMSHLHFLHHLPAQCQAHIIYLGSRGQYGKVCDYPIVEGSRMFPDDIQGVHKTTSDSYFRVLGRIKKLNITCLRFPNCFGIGQKYSGGDIGLIGSFIAQALQGKEIEIFGNHRSRNIVWVEDVARTVVLLSERCPNGYEDYNLSGVRINLVELVGKITKLVQSGSYHVAPVPEAMRAIDMGDIPVSDEKLRQCIGDIPCADVDESLLQTIEYFKEVLQ